MNKKNRITKDNIGIVYLFTNSCYEKENTYKFGITTNPFERKRIQSNSTPPTHPFYDRIILFSPHYKQIESWLKTRFREEGFLLTGTNGGREWVKADFNQLLEIYKEAIVQFPGTEMCFNGKKLKYQNGSIKSYRLPKCRLDLLGIHDGKEIICIQDREKFTVQDNKIIVNGSLITLSKYMSDYHPRSGNTNQYNGYQYFTYHRILIYDMWQTLVRAK